MGTRERLKAAAPYALFMVAFVCVAIRSVYGFGFTDEASSMATIDRFYRGQTPFLDDWSQEQLYCLLLLPLYSAYIAICGSNTGIYLAFRLLSLVISLVVALAAYRVFRREYNAFIGTCISLVFLFYAHGNVLGMSRYTLCSQFFMLGLVLAWYAMHRVRDMRDTGEPSAARVLEPLFSGVCFALAMVCNVCIIVIFLAVCLFGLIYAVIARRSKIYTPFAWAMVGVVLVALCYLFALLQFVVPIDLVGNVPNLILEYLRTASLDTCATSYLAALPVNTAAFIVTWVLVVFLIFWRLFGLRITKPFRSVVLALDIVCLLASCVTAATDANASSQVFIAFVECALPCFLLQEEVKISIRYHSELFFFWVPGLMLSIAWHLCAGGQGDALEIGMMFVSMGAFVTVMRAVPRPATLMAHSKSQAAPNALRCTCFVIIALMVALTGLIRMCDVHDDCAWEDMDAAFTEGPEAGIVTSAEHKKDVDELAEILECVEPGERVWIASGLNWAYLHCDGACAVPDMWCSTLSSETTAMYYSDSRRAKPDYIFVADRNSFTLENSGLLGTSQSYALTSISVSSINTVRSLESDGDYAVCATNDVGKLYKRTEFSVITSR